MRLAGKAAIITGAASGFGRASAVRFAREGAGVMLVDLNDAALDQAVAEIRAAGGTAISQRVDVTQADQVEDAWQRARRELGRLDIVFNNAGLPQSAQPIEATDETLFQRLLQVNVIGVFLGCRAAVPLLKAQGGGVILNTASTAGIRPRPGMLPYAATKGAVITFSRGLALELAPFKIRVVSINPVAAETPMLSAFLAGDDPAAKREQFVKSVPLGRLNTAEDVANAALFLASDEAAMVTGTAFEVDGGRDA